MRAARLLHILLLLQNRGRMNASQLATEVEVAPRTILRDIDALTEAGLPVVTYQGNRGGFELGFNYRTRLTGLATDEAEALAVLLADPSARLAELGMAEAAARATSKLLESLPRWGPRESGAGGTAVPIEAGHCRCPGSPGCCTGRRRSARSRRAT